MSSICKNQFPICKESSECMAKEAIQSLNNLLLSTIEEIDENNVEYSADVTTKWKYLARTINEAYKIVLNENSRYSDVSSNISKILNGEYIGEDDIKPSDQLDKNNQSKVSSCQHENIPEGTRDSASLVDDTLGKVSAQNKKGISQTAPPFMNQESILSAEPSELLDNYKNLEITTNMLIDEYLDMHKKTLSYIGSQNAAHCKSKDESLKDEVSGLIQQINTSIHEFDDTKHNLVSSSNTPKTKSKHDNFSNTEIKMYVLHRKQSASGIDITNQESTESLLIKTSSTEVNINLPTKHENAVQVIKEVVQDFHGYMRRIKQRIDRTKRDFDVLRTMLEGTILDCETGIIKAKKAKVKTIRSSYNLRMERGMHGCD